MTGDARRPTEAERLVMDAVSEALEELDAVARAPVQGEAMHKVVTSYVFQRLEAAGFMVTRGGI